MTGYSFAPNYWEAGWVPLPLPHGHKTPPPRDTTGRGARQTSYADVQTWLDENPDANIALRMPKNVVGLDFDTYKDSGVSAHDDLLAALGPLPATWRSSSRDDGSGILFFRADPDATDDLRDPRGSGGGLEIVRWSHRYAVVAPSLHPEGGTYRWYGPDGRPSRAPRVDDLPELPKAWLEGLTPAARPEHSAATVEMTEAGLAKVDSYTRKAVDGVIAKLRAMTAAATTDPNAYRGEPWDQTTFYCAARLFEFANAAWCALTPQDVHAIVMANAPRDRGFTDERVEEKLASAWRTTAGKAAAPPTGRADGWDMQAQALALAGSAQQMAPSTGGGRVIAHDNEVDVTNHALAADWLRQELGTGLLSGVFHRKGELVYTPRIGEEGYIAPRDARGEAAASISVMNEHDLQARIQHRYQVQKMTVDAAATKAAKKADPDAGEVWAPKPAIFPLESAKVVARAADDAPRLRELHGVVHTPTFRPDGSLITAPGYDDATGLLFLPTGGQPGPVPEAPSADDVQLASKWISYMLQDFRFVTEHDRATYIGLMVTPLLRSLVPPPYKLGVIEAHQPGSGKSFLARALTSIHGGTLHAEIPPNEEELQKVIGSFLDTLTGAVVVFDNVTGLVRSPTLAGLLTSPTFQGRRLGSSTVIEADNDRLWVITANNAALSGDLGRRNARVRIDPGVPNPELRTQFVISDFEGWVRGHRGELLWALLVLVRAWVVRGMPLFEEPAGDSYGRWITVVRSILQTAGIPGTFDDTSTRAEAVDPEADDFRQFLEVVHEVMGDRSWTAKSLLSLVRHPAMPDDVPGKPIPFDALPADLLRGKHTVEPSTLAGTLSRWLTNRKGRFYGDLCVKQVGSRTKLGVTWTTERYKH